METEEKDKKNFERSFIGCWNCRRGSTLPFKHQGYMSDLQSDGVLNVTIPKPARSDARKIEVKEAA